MLKQAVVEALQHALVASAQALHLETPLPDLLPRLRVERPPNPAFGDFAINVSPLAKAARMPPSQIAETLARHFPVADWAPHVQGGYVNLTVQPEYLIQTLVTLAHSKTLGQNQMFGQTRMLLEFVSANPTGPLHLGHGRWVALGDALGRILRHCGATVINEFYINDAGSQMDNIANSLWYRCGEVLQTGAVFPEPPEDKETPYPFYRGDYVTDLAEAYVAVPENAAKIRAWDSPDHRAPAEALIELRTYARETLLTQQRDLMARCGVHFSVWTSETALYESGAVHAMADRLKSLRVAYEKDGAWWLKTTALWGDDKDRVLIKASGEPTYQLPDIAYHDEKYTRDGGTFTDIVNIWGADHAGYVPRMKAAMKALGHDPDRLQVILGQLVHVAQGGQEVRMSKRAGTMVSLAQMVDEVGVDALRYWMVSKDANTPLTFDVDLAKSASDQNPVFYAQYAHARCASILRNAMAPRLDTLHGGAPLPPVVPPEDWQAYLQALTPAHLATLIADLAMEPQPEQAQSALKALILQMDALVDRVVEAAIQRAPHVIANYLQDLAADFHRFYAVCRIVTPEDPEKTKQRLVLIDTLKRIFAQALELLGVSAPERM